MQRVTNVLKVAANSIEIIKKQRMLIAGIGIGFVIASGIAYAGINHEQTNAKNDTAVLGETTKIQTSSQATESQAQNPINGASTNTAPPTVAAPATAPSVINPSQRANASQSPSATLPKSGVTPTTNSPSVQQQAANRPSASISFSEDGCDVIVSGTPGLSITYGATDGGRGMEDYATIPASGMWVGSTGGAVGLSSFARISDTNGNTLTSKSQPISVQLCLN